MKKLITSIWLLIVIANTNYAQSYNYVINNLYQTGYVYLKNGSVLKGKYVYSSDLSKIEISTKIQTLVLNAVEVEKILKKPEIGSAKKLENKIISTASKQFFIQNDTIFQKINPFNYTPSKFFNITEIGFLVGNEKNSAKNPFIVNSNFNYTIAKSISVGMGAGIEMFEETYLPLTLNAMYIFEKNQRIKPYISFQGGYEIPLEKATKIYNNISPYSYSSSYYYYTASPYYYEYSDMKPQGGFLINPSLGFVYQLTNGFGMGLSLGYRHHTLNYYRNQDYSSQIVYNRLSVKLGFIFN